MQSPNPKPKPRPIPKPQSPKSKAAEAAPHRKLRLSRPSPTAKRTRDGAVITFKGAGGRASAVFVRGLTAWVVLENAPDFDARNLKSALGDFAAGMEAVSSNGLGILRITLKAAGRNRGARQRQRRWKWKSPPSVAPPPVAIGFARNQADPKRASLSTLLPAADHAFKLLDPAGGDLLTIIPAQAGRGVPSVAQLRGLRRAAHPPAGW